MTLVCAMLISLFSQAFTFSPASAASGDPEPVVAVLVGDLQSELNGADWSPGDHTTRMIYDGNGFYHFTGTLPAGNYEYKVALNNSWDVSYGANKGGDNIKLSLAAEQEVTFYYNHNTHAIADTTHYTPLSKDQLPRLVGSIQSKIGDPADWDPAGAKALLRDAEFDNKVYTITLNVPKGSYEYKIALGPSWDVNYGADGVKDGGNISLNVLEDTKITFTYLNDATHAIYTDYSPGGSDGAVNAAKLYHYTWDKLYRTPFGAISAGEEVTLRLQSKSGDLTRARVLLKNYTSGSSKLYNMSSAGTAMINNEEVEIWEASITPVVAGVYGYKFLAGDGDAQIEYGEDAAEGGAGSAAASNAGYFQLTVYDPAFKTPDWMKEAVVYQIFPDRFFNGNPANDHVKDEHGSRGSMPIEHMDWSELPDNPDMKNEPGYQGDGEYNNDFFGGDIAGIHAKLDYLEALGVNTLYLNPIAEASSNHKYDAADWKSLDPMFGTAEEFEAFTTELQKRGMHLIMDGVFNHTGDDSIYFDRYGKYPTIGAYEYWSLIYDLMNDQGMTETEAKEQAAKSLTEEGQTFSPYGFENWFNIKNNKVDAGTANERYEYQSWWGFDSLPEIKSVPGTAVDYDSELNNEQFADYIFRDDDSAAKIWLTLGASGWRLDVANEVDPAFWQEFRTEIKDKKLNDGKDPLILGEIWDDASKYFLGDQYDSVMNYRFRGALINFLKNGNAESADSTLMAVKEDYPKEAFYALMNLMGSHDTARAVFVLGGGTDSFERAEFDKNYNYELGKSRLKLASIFQMGYPGAPTTYYGDEAGVTGSSDPDSRRVYPWGHEDTDLIEHYQKIGKVRTDHKQLFAYGELETLYASGDVYVYGRKLDNQYAIVAINRGNADKTVELNLQGQLKNGIHLTDQLNINYKVTTSNGALTLTVPAMDGRMLTADAGQSLALPAPVSNLTGAEGVGSVTLQWSPSGDAQEYHVYASTIRGSLHERILSEETITGTSASVSGLTNGKKYYFMVTAVDGNGNESPVTESSALVPHYSWNSGDYYISPATVTSSVYVDLEYDQSVTAEVWIKDATDQFLAEGLQAKLQIMVPGGMDWESLPASYAGQGGGYGTNNVFKGTFTAYEAGEYQYRMAFSTDAGRNWMYTDIGIVTISQDPSDKIPPVEDITLDQPLQESGQVNLSWSVTEVVYPQPKSMRQLSPAFDATTENAEGTDLMNAITENAEGSDLMDAIHEAAPTAAAEPTAFGGEQGADEAAYDSVFLYRIFRDSQPIAVVKGADLHTYRDYDVENGTTYTYFVRAYDRKGNSIDSNVVAVTPDLVMVEVTFKVHAPDYTPLSTPITIPGSQNNWDVNAWEMSRNGATSTDWEYTTFIQDGTSITYKYAKNKTWNEEGLADHTPNDSTLDNDVSYYGYGAEGTDLNVLITNQGGNKMVIEDSILRWIDQPVVVTSPMDGATLTTDTVTIRGNAIKGGDLKINGQAVSIADDMSFSKEISLKKGVNTITVSVAPDRAIQDTIFTGNSEAIGKATSTLTLTVTTTGGTVDGGGGNQGNNGNTGSGSTGNAGSSGNTNHSNGRIPISERTLKANDGTGKVVISLENGVREVALPANAADLLQGQSLEFVNGEVKVQIPADVLEQLKQQLPADQWSTAEIIFSIDRLSAENAASLLKAAEARLQAVRLTAAGDVLEFNLQIVPKNGSAVALSSFNKPVTLSLAVNSTSKPELLGVYHVEDSGQLQYAGGSKQDGSMTAEVYHFGKYAVLEYDKTYHDVPASFWATDVIKQMAAKHIIEGVSAVSFAPQKDVSRAEFAAMIARALDLNTEAASSSFADVDSSKWYADSVAAVAQAGIVSGRNASAFDPNAAISREEIAAIIVRAYQYVNGKSAEQAPNAEFGDSAKISDWAKTYVNQAVELGLMQGRGNLLFAPQDQATRAESAKLLAALIQVKKP